MGKICRSVSIFPFELLINLDYRKLWTQTVHLNRFDHYDSWLDHALALFLHIDMAVVFRPHRVCVQPGLFEKSGLKVGK
jgi:hypothetical protein